MNTKYIYALLCLITTLLMSCKENEGREVFPFSEPQLSNVSIVANDIEEAGNNLSFSLDIKDPLTPLSTLEVELFLEDKVIYTQSIRTKGHTAELKDQVVQIPFYAGFEGGAGQLKLTAINIEGSEKVTLKNFTIQHPTIPSPIYLHYEDKVIEMHRSEENPYIYTTDSDVFPEKFSGKISSSKELEGSKFIWVEGDENNETQLGNADSNDFELDFTDWEIEKVKFNTFTFSLDVEGISRTIKVKGTPLTLVDGLYQGAIDFAEGEDFEIVGIEDLKGAYNRDFFAYDALTGKTKFLRASGKWNVYYSVKYNYMWVARMEDVGPSAYWLVGNGFTCASVWHDDYNDRAWELDNVTGMGYMVKIAENKYQTTVYINNAHTNFDLQIYAKRAWDQEMAIFSKNSMSGDSAGFQIGGSANADLVPGTDFVPGYFQITLDNSLGMKEAKLDFKRLSN